MEMKPIKDKLIALIKKYRYAVLIVLIGLGMMMIPSHSKLEHKIEQPENTEQTETVSVSEELSQILSQVDGAGDVKVLLTVETGEEILYQTDEDVSVNSESSSTRVNTVVITGTDRDEYGLIRQTNPPVYKGAIVVCQGADDPKIQLAIVDAVANVTGLGADRISVLKMK